MKGLIFTYALTFGGALISLVSPYVGLLIYVCFAIIRPEAMWHWSVPAGNYSRIVAIGLLIGWGLQGFGSWRFGKAGAVVYGLLGFVAWACLSATQAAVDAAGAWSAVEALLKIVLPFLVGITTINSVAKLRTLAWVILLSQGYVAFELNLSYYQGFNRVQEVGFGGMDNNCVAIAMVAGAGLAFFLGLHEKRWWARLLCLTLALLMIHVVLFGFSRGGMLALILTAGGAFVLIPKQPKHYLLLALVVMAGLRLAGPEVQKRFASSFAKEGERDGSAQSRVDLWADMWDCAYRHPVLGVGPAQFPLIAHEYGWSAGKQGHSLWLQTLAEVGFPGAALLLLFYGACVIRLYGLCRRPETVSDPWLAYLARMVIASILGFAVAAQFVSIIGLELPYYITLVGAGVLRLHSTQPTPAEAVAPQSALLQFQDGHDYSIECPEVHHSS